MSFAKLMIPKARVMFGTRAMATTARLAGPRSLATPFASAVAPKPSAQELADHYNKYLDVYETDGSLVSTHTLRSRVVTHAPIEEILEAPVNANSEAAVPAKDNANYTTAGNDVYFVDGRQGKLSFA